MEFEKVITWMDWATIIFAFFAMIGTGYNFLQNRKQNQKIKIYFDVEGIDYLLDLDMPRKHISRSEIQGILSAFQNVPSQRYSIEYLSDINFLDDIYKIQNNILDELKIIISEKEMNGWKIDDKNFHDGFNKNKMKKL